MVEAVDTAIVAVTEIALAVVTSKFIFKILSIHTHTHDV